MLQSDGVIATRRGKGGGTIVLPGAAANVFAHINRDELMRRAQDVCEVRLALEPMAAALAASRAEEADLAALRGFQEDLSNSTEIETFRRADSGFHLAIAQASGNKLLRRGIEDARTAMFVMLDVRHFTIVHGPNCRAHESILEAIAARDPETAAQRMREHIGEASAEIAKAIEEQDAGGR